MKKQWLVVLSMSALALLATRGARADAAAAGASEFAIPASTLAAVRVAPTVSVARSGESPVVSALRAAFVGYEIGQAVTSPHGQQDRSRYDGLRYRPRRNWTRRAPDSQSVTQVHMGWFDPDGDQKPEFLVGVRGGPMVSPNVGLGAGIDWAHKSDRTSSVTRRTVGPGGTPIEVREDLSEASSHLVPIYGYVQLSADDNMGVIPYFGGSGGYQLLFLSARDFQTNEEFDATFGGWGWQVWGGLAVPLSGRSRLTGEIFVNGAELNRDVRDNLTGQDVRESVNGDGMGARFGIAWGF